MVYINDIVVKKYDTTGRSMDTWYICIYTIIGLLLQSCYQCKTYCMYTYKTICIYINIYIYIYVYICANYMYIYIRTIWAMSKAAPLYTINGIWIVRERYIASWCLTLVYYWITTIWPFLSKHWCPNSTLKWLVDWCETIPKHGNLVGFDPSCISKNMLND